VWLGIDVGSDIALANAIGREIIAAGLCNHEFIERATSGFEAYRQVVEPYTLARAARITGVTEERFASSPFLRARAARAGLLDARHHGASQRRRQRVLDHQPGAPDRARRPLRIRTRAAARPEQRAGRRRHGRDSEPVRRRQDVEDAALRAKFEREYRTTLPPDAAGI
jgi:hypothetical protein